MNPEVKQKWIAALRSGKYKQGRNGLRTKSNGMYAYCCLGVLSDISGQGKWQKDTYVVSGDRSASWLSLPVIKWAGLDSYVQN